MPNRFLMWWIASGRMQFYEEFLGGPVITFDKTMASLHGEKAGTTIFTTIVFTFGRGTQNRYTMWSALTDIGLENGPLVICLGSHRHERLKSTYGATDMDRDLTEAVFSTDPREIVEKFGFTLATAHFQPGDVIIFGLYMMHSSAPNRSDRYRISIDTRYQLAREKRDNRFFFREDGSWLGKFLQQRRKLQTDGRTPPGMGIGVRNELDRQNSALNEHRGTRHISRFIGS